MCDQQGVKRYFLGRAFPEISFNEREVLILIGLFSDKSPDEIANDLHCTMRTIFFYIESMKKILSCSSIEKLIECIKQSELFNQIRHKISKSKTEKAEDI